MTEESLNKFYQKIENDVEKFGLSIIGVGGDGTGPSFSYTIGLFREQGFELLCIGLNPQFSAAIFNDIAQGFKAGKNLVLDEDDDRWANLPTRFKMCNEKAHEYVFQADAYNGMRVRVVQMIMPDKNGKFYDDPAYDHVYMGPRQPLVFDL